MRAQTASGPAPLPAAGVHQRHPGAARGFDGATMPTTVSARATRRPAVGRSSEPDVFDLATRSAEVRASLAVSYLVDGLLDPRFEFPVLGHP